MDLLYSIQGRIFTKSAPRADVCQLSAVGVSCVSRVTGLHEGAGEAAHIQNDPAPAHPPDDVAFRDAVFHASSLPRSPLTLHNAARSSQILSKFGMRFIPFSLCESF